MSLADSYTREIRRELKRFATWQPGLPVRLGDFGTLNGSLFSHLGNLRDLGVGFERRKDPSDKRVYYSSKGGVEVEAEAGASADLGPVAKAKAALKVTFGAQHAVLFNAAGVTYESVADHLDLQRKLLQLLEQDGWDPRHVIVTELMHSGSTTVAVSAGSNGSLLLEAEGDLPKIDLADAGVRLGVKSERNIGYRIVTAEGMTPLLGLSRIRPRGAFWWGKSELQRVFGLEGVPGGKDPETVPETFQATLDEHLDSLMDRTRAGAAPAEEAFEWAELQPPERPATE